METIVKSPFRSQISVTLKKLQVLKLREYIYNYLLQKDDFSEAEAYSIANTYPEFRVSQNKGLQDRDINYINGRLEEIQKLKSEICNYAV